MFRKSKYDVMKKEELKLSAATLFYLGKISMLQKRYAEDTRENRANFIVEMSELMIKMFPHLVSMSHIGYENAKDLFELDKDVLEESLKRQGINIQRFSSNYSKVIARYSRNIFVAMVLEEENIDISKINDIIALINLVQGDPSNVVRKYLVDTSAVLKPDNLELVASMSSSNFDLMNLDSKQINRLNEYHEKFMREKIYPQVSKERLESDKVLKLARRISNIEKGRMK